VLDLSVFGVDVNSGPPVEMHSSNHHITEQDTTKLHVSFSRLSVLHNCELYEVTTALKYS